MGIQDYDFNELRKVETQQYQNLVYSVSHSLMHERISQHAIYCPIDLTDYSFLPDGLVSMLTYFSMSGADKIIFACFPGRSCFLLFLGSITK